MFNLFSKLPLVSEFGKTYMTEIFNVSSLNWELNEPAVQEKTFVKSEIDDDFNVVEVITKEKDTVINFKFNAEFIKQPELLFGFDYSLDSNNWGVYGQRDYYLKSDSVFYQGSASLDYLPRQEFDSKFYLNICLESLVGKLNISDSLKQVILNDSPLNNIQCQINKGKEVRGRCRILFNNEEDKLIFYLMEKQKKINSYFDKPISF
jgi:hypothetical protein